MAKSPAPEIIRLSAAELEKVLVELRASVAPGTYQVVEAALRTLQWVVDQLEQKRTSLLRLQRILFGDKTEKTRNLLPTEPAKAQALGPDRNKAKGHGRKGTHQYPGAQRLQITHPTHRVGNRCPKCGKGKLYLLKVPARLVRITAQPIFQATITELERLRCALCGALFTAPAPAPAAAGKYDPSVGVMLALMRYGAGLPMYRTGKWQEYFGVPLAPSTQWELIAEASITPGLIYKALIGFAAQGQLVHNDDTTMRVQSLRVRAPSSEASDQRTGVFTTGIVSHVGVLRVALFFTGSNHAGENLDELLSHRAAEQAPPLQMCDGLSRNEPKTTTTLLSHCLLHGRRLFVEQLSNFPQECRHVIESLREVYRWDAQARKQNLSDTQRLALHQQHSRPVMDQLHRWMSEQLQQKRVEPNSNLGQAISYMLKRWQSLTRFLSAPGAPLDNNIAERTLKMAILHRKNSLSYKTLNGARVGDVHMSLIRTCELNRINPFQYLMALQQHADQVAVEPVRWLPWNYRQAIEAAGPG